MDGMKNLQQTISSLQDQQLTELTNSMNGFEENQEQVLWVICDPSSAQEGIALDPHQIAQAIQLGQGTRASSPPPLVPITNAANNQLQSCLYNTTSICSNFVSKQKLVQDDNQDSANYIVPEKNEVSSTRDGDQAKTQCKLSCKFCSKTYGTKKAVTNHQYMCPKNPKKKVITRVECLHCHKTFGRKVHLTAHLNSKGCDKVPLSRMCPYVHCSFKYRFRTVFIDHLRDKHKEDIAPGREMQFDSWDDFFEWKNDEEVRTFSYYSQQFGKRDNRAYFYCQHDDPSGGVGADDPGADNPGADDPRARAARKRGPNQKGRIKAGKLCFSMIHVHGVNKEGQLRVTYFPTHSHEPDMLDVRFQPTNAATREYIKQQIASGVPPEEIRESLIQEPSNLRSDFISVRAIKEQKRLYCKTINCLEDQQRAQEIVESLLGSYDDVLILKPAGGPLIVGPESARELSLDVFLLGIQTKEQSEKMRELSKSWIINAKVDVALYGCKLLTIFGVDEMNKGYPLAHCLSSNLDEPTLKHFFCSLKERDRLLCVAAFVTETFEPSVTNAVRKGLGDDRIQDFVCAWSFLMDLERKIDTKVEDGEASSMFADLCDLVAADTEARFDQLLTDFRLTYSDTNSSFMRYFNCMCVPKKTKWALCFRDIRCTTAMYAESFHNTLRSAYAKQELSKGLGTLVDLLMRTERACHSVRDVLTCPTGNATINDNISVRHTKSLGLPEAKQVIRNRLWEVRSKNKVHRVMRCSPVCTNPSDCYFRCAECPHLCVHLYLCTCKDQNPLCKHIHNIHSANLHRETCEDEDDVECENTQREAVLSLLTKLREHVERDAVQKLHPRLLSTLSELNAECLEEAKSSEKKADRFTPPIDYVDNPNEAIFRLDDQSFSLASIKSLEPWLPQSEIDLLERTTEGQFRVGWIYENIINTYLSILSTTYCHFTPFDTSVMQSLLNADEETFKTFWGSLQTRKVIFIPIISDHYTSAVVLLEDATVICYDPIAESSIDGESLDALNRGLALAFPQTVSWSLKMLPGTSVDVAQSGVHVCAFAEQVAKGVFDRLTVDDVNFRKTMHYSIFGFCLKRPTFVHNRCGICREVARTNSVGTIKCARCKQLFHRMCLQRKPGAPYVCPLILPSC